MEDKELRNIAPKLHSIKKDSPFKVPEDYFENFARRIQDKISEEKNLSAYQRIAIAVKPMLKLAAAFVLLALFAYLITYFITDNTKNNDINYASNDQVNVSEQYILDNAENTDIISVMNNDSTTESNDIESDKIIDYLVNENVDYLAYIEEF